MGNWICKREKNLRILIQGLDAAGKTSILYRLKLGQVVTTIPTIGFNVETVDVGGISIVCWDVGGRDKIRPLYRHYYPNTDAFVYVIDSTDRERLSVAIEELVRFVFLEDETRNTVVMVLANKQDKPGAMTPSEIEQALVEKYKFSPNSSGNHTVFIRPCSAVTGEGLFEAFSDLTEQISLKKSEMAKCGLLPLNEQEDKANKIEEEKKSEKSALEGFKFLLKDPFAFLKSWHMYNSS